MADVRVIQNVVISDPTTPSQIAAVDASGRLSVSLAASSATVTVDSELPAAAALADGASNPTTPTIGGANLVWNTATWDRERSVANSLDSTGTGIQAVGIVGQLDDTSTSTVTENQFASVRISSRRALLVEGVASGTNINVNLAASAATVTVDSELPAAAALADATSNPTAPAVGSFLMGWNTSTWDRLRSDTTNGLDVDVTRVSGTVTVDSELPAAAALADATSNPTVPGVGAFALGFNGTTWDRIRTANTGRLQVDVVTGGGTDVPTSPVNKPGTSAALAAGSSANIQTVDLGASGTLKLAKVRVGSSVAAKWIIQAVDNAVATELTTVFTQAGESLEVQPRHRNYWSHTFTANAGFDGFQVNATNLDASEAADVYATMEYEA
jgi:hypothetical protein